MTGSVLLAKKKKRDMSAGGFLFFFFHFIKVKCGCVVVCRKCNNVVAVPPSFLVPIKTESSMSFFDSVIECLNTILENIWRTCKKWFSLPHFEAVIKKLQENTTDITPSLRLGMRVHAHCFSCFSGMTGAVKSHVLGSMCL